LTIKNATQGQKFQIEKKKDKKDKTDLHCFSKIPSPTKILPGFSNGSY